MITGYLAFSVLMAASALSLSVSAGHPPLAWVLAYSGAGATSLIAMAFFRSLTGGEAAGARGR